MDELTLLVIGWLLGLVSSLLSGFVLFWLEGVRIRRNDIRYKRENNLRAAINWSLSDKKASFRGCDFVGQNLSGIDLSEIDLADADFTSAMLSGTVFRRAKLHRVNFSKTNLNGADFSFADLGEAYFYKSNLQNANFDCSTLKATIFRKIKDIEKNHSFILARYDETTKLPPKMLNELLEYRHIIENASDEELRSMLDDAKTKRNDIKD